MQDADGAIALFLSGYGPIPQVVLSEAHRHHELDVAMSQLPDISNTYYEPDCSQVSIDAKNSIFKEVKAVAKGLYVYDNEEYTDVYKRVAVPKVIVRADQLDSAIGLLLRPNTFSDLIFHQSQSLNLEKYFECD